MANYSDKANSIALQLSGGGSGSGETNYVTNGSGAVALDRTGTNDEGDWIDSGASNFTASVTTTSAELPREFLTTTAIKFKPVTTTAADYVRYRFQIGEADKNRKLKIQWAQLVGSTVVNDEFKVELWSGTDATYATTTEVPLSGDDTSGDSFIKATNGGYINTFSAGSDDYYELRIVKVGVLAVVSTDWITLNDVVIGPGIGATGAVVGPWTEFTPIWLFMGTFSTQEWFYRRVGDGMEIQGQSTSSGAGLAGVVGFTLPEGLTVRTLASYSAVHSGRIGSGMLYDSSESTNDRFVPLQVYPETGGVISFTANTINNGIQGTAIANGDRINFTATVPIEEWRGLGTVNLINDNVSQVNARGSFSTVGNMLFAADSVERIVPFEDSDSEFGNMTIDGAGTVTIPASGVYRISAQLQDASTPNYMGIWVYRNGASVAESIRVVGNQIGIEADRYFDEGDTLAIFAKASGGGNIATVDGDRTWFTAIRVADYTAGQAVGFGEATTEQLGLVKKGSVSTETLDDSTMATGVTTTLHTKVLTKGTHLVMANWIIEVLTVNTTSRVQVILKLDGVTLREYYLDRFGDGLTPINSKHPFSFNYPIEVTGASATLAITFTNGGNGLFEIDNTDSGAGDPGKLIHFVKL